MAHDIEQKSDMFCAGNRKAPWHDMYTKTDGLLTVEQARERFFDWEPTLQPLISMDIGGEPMPVNSHCAVVRSDSSRLLGVVGSDYGVIQNKTIAKCAGMIAGDSACVETGGNIQGGKRVWYLISTGDSFRINGDSSAIKPFLLFSSTHDGSGKHIGKFTSVRVECNNTLEMALGAGASSFAIRHTVNGEMRAEEAAGIMAAAVSQTETWKQWAEEMAKVRWSLPQMRRLAAKLLPAKNEDEVPTVTKNNRERIVDLFETGDGHESIQGTAWAAINAVTQWCDHERRVLGKTDEVKRDNRLNSIWFGQSNNTKNQAARIVTEEALATVPAGPAGAVN